MSIEGPDSGETRAADRGWRGEGREGRIFSLEFFGVSGLKVGKAGVKNKKVVL
jgi:hypothetical protein